LRCCKATVCEAREQGKPVFHFSGERANFGNVSNGGGQQIASRFAASIAVLNGAPVVTWTPNLGTDRAYTVEGKPALTDATWGATNGTSRFFRVKVELP